MDDKSGPDKDKREQNRDDDAYGDTPQAERETIRGEQGTSSGDPHDDTDPQSG